MEIGAIYIPKWNQNRPLGEDAHFVCEAEQAFGVADGVYARQLMTSSATAVHLAAGVGVIDPMAVIGSAYTSSKAAAERGSSTACVAALRGARLRIANVGGSGFWVFRNKRCVYAPPIQRRREFNCDPDRIECIMKPGDMIVMGSDGLLDNVYPYEIKELLRLTEEEGIELDAEQLAHQIAGIALVNSEDKKFCSPFQLAARSSKSGSVRHTGGKIDDITVIVALIL